MGNYVPAGYNYSAVISAEPFWTRPGLGTRIDALVALAPAVIIVLFSIKLNHFAFLDDGVTLLTTRGTVLDAFRMPDHGRYFPFYIAFHVVLMSVLPPQPWSFSLANGVLLLVGAWQVQRFARLLAGRLAGIAAAWLFVLNLSTVENIFTLSKAEPKQLVFWLATLTLLGRALKGTEDRLTRFEAPLMFFCATATVFFKETGLLLWFPLSLFAGMTWRTWSASHPELRQRRLGLLVAGVLPLALSTAIVFTYGIRRGSYAREQVIGGAERALFPPPLPGHDVLLASVLVAGLIGGLFFIVGSAKERGLVALLWVQLAAFAAFFAALRAWMPYFYLTGVALAAVLLSAALLNPAIRAPAIRTAAAAVILFVIGGGITRSVAGASALAGWSSLYDRLTTTVVTERPPRVFFHRTGSWEVHVEARMFWEALHGLRIVVGVLDADPAPYVPAVTRRDLRAGDWIIEQFGTPRNVEVPFRDLGATRPLHHGLINRDGTFLPLRLVHTFRAEFPVPPRGLSLLRLRRTYLQWQIYQVTETPRLIFEGLDEDDWMGRSARLWIRAPVAGPVAVRFRPFVHVPSGGRYANELLVYAGDTVIARCPVADQGVSRCAFGPMRAPDEDDVERWAVLDLRAATTFVPRGLGVTPDTGNFSFNFGPTREPPIAAPDGMSPRP